MLLRPVLFALAALMIGLSVAEARADSSIIQTHFTADPAPLIPTRWSPAASKSHRKPRG
jgi:arabinoxylan arabinofuranohydrolase